MKVLLLSAALSLTLSVSAMYFFSSSSGQQQLLSYVGLSDDATPSQSERPRRNFDVNNRPARSE
ncbi:hypothetical protein [Marinomonas pontica]|uniref:hypothetical protein n=1 Tax=Marinomonas pontica TaxID=264739 RepID=UPI0030C77E11